jgi:hypothetical protein
MILSGDMMHGTPLMMLSHMAPTPLLSVVIFACNCSSLLLARHLSPLPLWSDSKRVPHFQSATVFIQNCFVSRAYCPARFELSFVRLSPICQSQKVSAKSLHRLLLLKADHSRLLLMADQSRGLCVSPRVLIPIRKGLRTPELNSTVTLPTSCYEILAFQTPSTALIPCYWLGYTIPLLFFLNNYLNTSSDLMECIHWILLLAPKGKQHRKMMCVSRYLLYQPSPK